MFYMNLDLIVFSSNNKEFKFHHFILLLIVEEKTKTRIMQEAMSLGSQIK